LILKKGEINLEKFALLDFLKAFESLSAKGNGKPDGEKKAENGQNTQSEPKNAPQQPPVQPDIYENNVMANVLARHEEISNRLRNKK